MSSKQEGLSWSKRLQVGINLSGACYEESEGRKANFSGSDKAQGPGERSGGEEEQMLTPPELQRRTKEETADGLGLGLEAGLQAVKGAGGAGGSRRFTGVDGQVDAAVDGVVVLVGRRGLAGELAPPAGGVIVRVVDEGDAGRGVLYPKLGVRHEVVDGRS